MNKKENKKESQTKEAIVNFLDIDTKKITFKKPKPNKHNGKQIGILYEGKTLYVKYEGITPFGLQENYDKEGNYEGTNMQINCEDLYLQKAKELDSFFINYMHSQNKKIPIQSVSGYDEHGQGGSWKRICKKPYKVENDEREYLDYPSKMEFKLFYRDDKLQTRFFTHDKKSIEYENVKIGSRSEVKFIAAWFSITTGTFGSTIKPKLMQIIYSEPDSIFNDFILDSDNEEDEENEDEDYNINYEDENEFYNTNTADY